MANTPKNGDTTTAEGNSGPEERTIHLAEPAKVDLSDTRLEVALGRSAQSPTDDQALWAAIRNRTAAIGFRSYEAFIHRVLCRGNVVQDRGEHELHDHVADLRRHGVDAYGLLKAATEAFLLLESGVRIEPASDPDTGEPTEIVPGLEESRFGEEVTPDAVRGYLRRYLGSSQALPYLDRIVSSLFPGDTGNTSPFCTQPLWPRIERPLLLELIWSYWHEEGMLVQSVHALTLRFQNKGRGTGRDSLAQLELDPLRPIGNLLWGYIQDEPFRLTVTRRAYEYEHHYGLSLLGKAVPRLRPADRRSKFLEAFHSLLRQTAAFYKEDADTTVIADGFPLLNGLKETHMLLAEGAHNQFGDLPWTARVEMLIQEWLLARVEIKEFLRGRAMVPYKESWMGQVDTMRKVQGWGDTPVTQFRDLGVYGEQILLSIRYGDWVEVSDQEQAKNWARYWRPEIQGYLHAYRAATGVDLVNSDPSRAVDATPPSVLLRQRRSRRSKAS